MITATTVLSSPPSSTPRLTRIMCLYFQMMIDDIRQVLRTYHKFIPESRLKLFMMKRDFLTIGSMWSLGQVSVGVLCWFFYSLSLLDPILLVTNHKERIDV